MQFLRKITLRSSLCTISEVRAEFRGNRPLWGRDVKGGGGELPKSYEVQNSPLQLGLMNMRIFRLDPMGNADHTKTKAW